MAIIATYAEGHNNHGEIIAWARSPWPAIKQYEDPNLAYLLFDLADDEEPVEVMNFGPVSSHHFVFGDMSAECENVYQEALIDKRKVEVK